MPVYERGNVKIQTDVQTKVTDSGAFVHLRFQNLGSGTSAWFRDIVERWCVLYDGAEIIESEQGGQVLIVELPASKSNAVKSFLSMLGGSDGSPAMA